MHGAVAMLDVIYLLKQRRESNGNDALGFEVIRLGNDSLQVFTPVMTPSFSH